jgi:periplasmic protein TonB
MAYADQRMSSSRITAIVIVALLHALLGYAFVTGLAYNVVKKMSEDLKTFDVEEEPPPPEEEPPPPQDVPEVQPPPVVSPPPIVRVNTQAPIIQTVRVAPPPVITPTAPPAPPAPPPAPPKRVEPARAKANLASYVSDEDYPAAAIRAEEQGTTRFRLSVGPDGRVTNCTVTSSSGSSSLDATTCRLMQRRARFSPARDSTGAATSDTVNSAIKWVLPDE